jgi:hypothetical protein
MTALVHFYHECLTMYKLMSRRERLYLIRWARKLKLSKPNNRVDNFSERASEPLSSCEQISGFSSLMPKRQNRQDTPSLCGYCDDPHVGNEFLLSCVRLESCDVADGYSKARSKLREGMKTETRR